MGVDAAAIYVRISRDVAGTALGVARQEADCRALCERLGWPIAEVYVDNDLSAYSGKPRPAYLRLLADIAERSVDGLAVWDPDRLHRSPTELEAFITLVETTGVEVATVNAGNYDLTTASGRMTARVVGAVARHESEHKSERVRRKHLEIAVAGRPNGGPRPFGYVTAAGPLEPLEAEMIRDACQAILEGGSIRSVQRAWNLAGVPTPRGGVWPHSAVRRVLTAGRIAGLREYRGEIVGPAEWPAIVERDVWEQVRARLFNRPFRPGPRRWFLSGFLTCGKCGAKLAASNHNGYSCRVCNGISIKREPLEELIALRVVDALADGLPAFDGDDTAGITAELVAIAARMREWDEDRDNGIVDRARWLAATQRLESQAEALRRRYGALRPAVRAVGALDRDAWDALTLDQQSAVLGELIETIVVHPKTITARVFDPARVEVRWLA